MPTEADRIKQLFAAAEADPDAQAAREHLARTLAEAFRRLGALLWVAGAIIGGDRVAGRSPFDFGSDANVGIALVAQIAGELTSGVIALLDQDNIYGAAALLRQIVEVEYLAWAFGSDKAEAETWLRSSRDERLKIWQPRHLRDRSKGRFRGVDYAMHCERGGHPTPYAMQLLPEHPAREGLGGWWFDLCSHGSSTWRYLSEALPAYGWSDGPPDASVQASVEHAIEVWKSTDTKLFGAFAELSRARSHKGASN